MQSSRPLKYPGDWIRRHQSGEKIVVLTAYDAGMARLLAGTTVDALLIGDSLGMVVQGQKSTLPVTLDEIIYHCRMVRRGAPEMFLIGDLPFGSYQAGVESGIANAFRLMKEGGVDAVKLEGAHTDTLRIVQKLVEAGVPVMGHLGLTPQSVLVVGGYRVQGRGDEAARVLLEQARALEDAGCFSIVLELVTASVARQMTAALKIPTIGIGAGAGTSGQVLVVNDMLGLDPSFHTKHSKVYARLGEATIEAANRFSTEVRDGTFPAPEQSFE